MLTGMGMGGMGGMTIFYDHCVETLYPPGSCGLFCNQHSYDCRMEEIHSACCHGGNCVREPVICLLLRRCSRPGPLPDRLL